MSKICDEQDDREVVLVSVAALFNDWRPDNEGVIDNIRTKFRKLSRH